MVLMIGDYKMVQNVLHHEKSHHDLCSMFQIEVAVDIG